jgi:hypothetical protein
LLPYRYATFVKRGDRSGSDMLNVGPEFEFKWVDTNLYSYYY